MILSRLGRFYMKVFLSQWFIGLTSTIMHGKLPNDMEINKKAVFINAVRQLPSTREVDRNEAILNIFKGVEEYILDTAGTIVASNLEAVTITGYEEWEIIGRHFSIFYSIE